VEGPRSSILTVSSLNQLIRLHLEEVFPEVWVEGEISNLRVPSSGHTYLTLKDASGQIRGVVFRSSGRKLRFAPQEGMHILCRGQVTVYEPRGEYQLIITYMEPRGAGAFQVALEQLKEKLKKEGLFDPLRKRPLPLFPKRIGVVTSPTGAAIWDILKVLHRRLTYVHVLLNPVPVQGEGSAQAIASAINEFNAMSGIDVLIVGRGGGSLEDLWAFNEEVVARAIYDSRIPVISAVGHEIDYTISDWVADLRASTPSAASEMILQCHLDLHQRIASYFDRIQTAIHVRLESETAHIHFRVNALRDPSKVILGYSLRVDDIVSRMQRAIRNILRHHQSSYSHLKDMLLYQNPIDRLRRFSMTLSHTVTRLRQEVGSVLKVQESRMQGILGRLDSLSPLAILGRGYSLSYRLPERQLLREADQVTSGDKVEIRLHHGTLVCDVEEVRKEVDS